MTEGIADFRLPIADWFLSQSDECHSFVVWLMLGLDSQIGNRQSAIKNDLRRITHALSVQFLTGASVPEE